MKPFFHLIFIMSFLAIAPKQLFAQNRIDKRQPGRSQSAGRQSGTAKVHPNNTDAFTYQIIAVADNTFGYDVLVNNKITIHQTTIPGRSGTKGFSSKKDASRVAEAVIKKMKSGQMPPTISTEELNKILQVN